MQIEIDVISAGKKVLDELTANIHPDQKAVLLDKMAKMISCDITCAGSPVDRKLHEMYLDLCDEQARESLDATYNVSFYYSVYMHDQTEFEALNFWNLPCFTKIVKSDNDKRLRLIFREF